MPQGTFEHRKSFLVIAIALVLAASVSIGFFAGFSVSRGGRTGLVLSLLLLPLVPLASFLFYKKTIFPYYRRLEDANLELHLNQEELYDTKDDLFVKFLGVYDVNYAANSPRLFTDRLQDVADITARVMEADACFIYLYDAKKDELVLSATNAVQEEAVGKVRIPLGVGIEGWVGRRLDPVMLKDFHSDPRHREAVGLSLGEYHAIYCLPLFVYSNGALVGVMEVFYRKARTFPDEEVNFFTTLSGILSTTIQNEQMQVELNKINLELEQWVSEKTEELRSSEERYRTLVENSGDSIFVLAENGDIVFANNQAAHLTGAAKYDLLHKNLFEFFTEPIDPAQFLQDVRDGGRFPRRSELRTAGGEVVPVDITAAELLLMGKHFVQAVVRDSSTQVRLEKLLAEKETEVSALKARFGHNT